MKKVLLLLVLVLLASGCFRAENSRDTDPTPSAGSADIPPNENSGPEECVGAESEQDGFDLCIPDGAEEISRTGVFDEEEGAVLDEVVFRLGEDIYTYRTQFTGRLKNISGFPDEFVRGEHDDLIPEETPRCYTDAAAGAGVMLWLKDGRMFSLSMTEGAEDQKLSSLYLLLTGSP